MKRGWVIATLAASLLPAVDAGAQKSATPAKRAPVKKAPARTVPPRPVTAPTPPPAPAAGPGISAVNLAPTLRTLGYMTTLAGGFQRLRIEEDRYGYFLDVGLSPSGDWVVAMAHLATVPDLTKVPSAPLLALLGTNDSLLGMAFSYDRVNGRLMLNATVPARSLSPESLKNMVEGLKATVKKTDGLWDTAQW